MLVIVIVKKMKLVKPEDKSSVIDDEFMAWREEIHEKIPHAIMRWFNTENDIEYLEGFIRFLEAGEFQIH